MIGPFEIKDIIGSPASAPRYILHFQENTNIMNPALEISLALKTACKLRFNSLYLQSWCNNLLAARSRVSQYINIFHIGELSVMVISM